ncbi:MAG: prepilin-type N-terminal cleavage/methylation domain-containing protein [Candidatus Gastranaerophilales bacterium]
MKKRGFTLSEVMIAITIVGILAAIITPTIMGLRPNKNKMMIKKSYYIAESVVSGLINDTSLYEDMTSYCTMTPYDDCAYGFEWEDEVTYQGETYKDDEKFQRLFAAKVNLNSYNTDYSEFTTSDGIKWIFDDTSTTGLDPISDGWSQSAGNSRIAPSNNERVLVVDVNGDNEPNEFENGDNKFDRYRIVIRSNGKIRIHENDVKAKEYITISSSIHE